MTAFENLNRGKTPNRRLRAIALPVAGALALALALAHGENVQVGQVDEPTATAGETFVQEASDMSAVTLPQELGAAAAVEAMSE